MPGAGIVLEHAKLDLRKSVFLRLTQRRIDHRCAETGITCLLLDGNAETAAVARFDVAVIRHHGASADQLAIQNGDEHKALCMRYDPVKKVIFPLDIRRAFFRIARHKVRFAAGDAHIVEHCLRIGLLRAAQQDFLAILQMNRMWLNLHGKAPLLQKSRQKAVSAGIV